MRRLLAVGVGLVLGLASLAPLHAGRIARITYYVESGYMADGNWTYRGAAACSFNIPLGSTVYVAGDPYVCEDRGNLGWSDWIDIYCPFNCEWIPATYGDYAEVEVSSGG